MRIVAWTWTQKPQTEEGRKILERAANREKVRERPQPDDPGGQVPVTPPGPVPGTPPGPAPMDQELIASEEEVGMENALHQLGLSNKIINEISNLQQVHVSNVHNIPQSRSNEFEESE